MTEKASLVHSHGLWMVSTRQDHTRVWWKEKLKSRLVAKFSAVAATGQRSAEYIESLGISKEKIFQVGNVVDNNHFAAFRSGLGPDTKKTRESLQLPKTYFLTVCHLAPEKSLEFLLEAYRRYRDQGGAWDLVILGDGPERNKLETIIHTKSIAGVSIRGWVSYDDLPPFYGLASCFILPSLSEPWGLVVNEAMACGLPILVSDRCGCLPELCHDGVNGFSFDPKEGDLLTKRMLDISNGYYDPKIMGKASQDIIAKFTPESWATKLKVCLRAG